MASYGDALSALDAYRAELYEQTSEEIDDQLGPQSATMAFAAHGTTIAPPGPLTNVHATGVGIRMRKGQLVPNEYVLKVYVFQKQALGAATPLITSTPYQGVEVDVEELPVQQALVLNPAIPAAVPSNRSRHRPIIGGVSIAPLHASYVGTLGCFVKRTVAGTQQLFALSNNHVLADTNQLSPGSIIVQPGPEVAPTLPTDAFAQLSSFIPIRFPQVGQPPATNFYDAAIARVTDEKLVKRATMLGIPKYVPKLTAPQPGMPVTKSGRTTGVTQGTVVATHVNGVQVNYGTQSSPLIAVFNDTVEVRGSAGSFSLPGDSGSVILEQSSGRAVSLLFAGSSGRTFGCNLAGACRRFRVTLA